MSKKKNRKNDKKKSEQLDNKDLEKVEEEISEDSDDKETEETDDIEDKNEESKEESEDENDSEDDEEDDSDEEDSEDDEEDNSDEEDSEDENDSEDKVEKIEDSKKTEEVSEKEKKKKQKSKDKNKENKEEDSDEEPDYFWVKVLIVTLIIIWAALIAGSWAGNYFLKSEFFKKYNSQVVDENKPKVWKTVVEVDKSGAVSKSAVLADNTDDLQIDDFRNTNEPIPGIDDQSLKNLKDIEPLQEPSDDSSAIEIQIASEETMDNANKIAEDLKAKGYNPLVEPFVENGVNRFRVKISESSEENANKKLEELKALEYKPFIIGK